MAAVFCFPFLKILLKRFIWDVFISENAKKFVIKSFQVLNSDITRKDVCNRFTCGKSSYYTSFKYCSGFEITSYIITCASVICFSPLCHLLVFPLTVNHKIENLQEQLRDKDKQLGNLKDRVKSLQTDSSNTDTALATLEEALSEKVEQTQLYANLHI